MIRVSISLFLPTPPLALTFFSFETLTSVLPSIKGKSFFMFLSVTSNLFVIVVLNYSSSSLNPSTLSPSDLSPESPTLRADYVT